MHMQQSTSELLIPSTF